MSTIKESLVGVDYLKLGILKDFLQNPLTTSQRNTLSGTLGVLHKGLSVYDTDESTLYHWTGSVFATNPALTSGLVPQGSVAFNATEPVSPSLGDLYVFNSAGTNTWEGPTVVQVGDQVWWDGTIWQFIQGNVVQATELISGIIELATQAEVNTGTDAVRAVTPATLSSWSSTKAYAKVYFVSGFSLTADTPATVTHNLALQNRDSFAYNIMKSNSSANVDVDSIDANSCSITSNITTTVNVTIIGF